MWLHLPEMSINLAQALRVIPQADGKLQIVQPDNITVTVDGGKAKAGNLVESVRVSSKSDPSIATTLGINATIP